MQSPAPTVDRGAVIVARACTQLVGRDEEGAVAAEADRDDLDAVGDELTGGGAHVAAGSAASWPTSSASSSWLGLMRCGRAATAAVDRGAGGVDGDPDAALAHPGDQGGVQVGGGAGRQAAAADDPVGAVGGARGSRRAGPRPRPGERAGRAR